MGKRRPPRPPAEPEPELFSAGPSRRRRALFLPTYLREEAEDKRVRGPRQDAAHAVLTHWADLERQGHLRRKETALDASFLTEVFGRALGYATVTESPSRFFLERNFTVLGVGTADGALGEFAQHGHPPKPVAVIELKGAGTDLDRDKSNGRTPVQQCWDYLNALPECPWGIVSNFVTIRLYHRDKTPLAYEEFRLQDLRREDRFRQFYWLLEHDGLLPSATGQAPRALSLLERTTARQREVGDELYAAYADNRFQLIQHLHRDRGKTLDAAIHIAQKILDRIIFIAFCEDRGLLPEQCITAAYDIVAPFAKVTNPRWRNFLDLFHSIDKGNNNLTAYNGGLFRHDPEVDDLQLDDTWTNFFRTVSGYDFRDEINVDVLGHLFERSVGELEQIRAGGLFGAGNGNGEPAMPKSPQRKRLGIYYTPPEFTALIVRLAVSAVMDERIVAHRQRCGVTDDDLTADKPTARLADYWRGAFEVVRSIKVCDPACGSGAFLVQAYDVMEARYQEITDHLHRHDPTSADALSARIPDVLLADNLYGVDVSEQGVEITQLALWLRSARPKTTLADLSRNVVWGNSLVDDPDVHPKAMNWAETFPGVFNRTPAGFDCVIGNPPWERMKLQEREFFAHSAPKIAGAVNAAERRRLIARLADKNPVLHALYEQAQQSAERTLAHVRASGRFPLTAKGDVNTYMLFAELARTIVGPNGRVGVLVPSGIATDNTTREFFGDVVDSNALICFYDFENKAPVFPDVHRSYKFCAFVCGGSGRSKAKIDFVFFAHDVAEIEVRGRHIDLSSKDIALLNPNTRTCPIFRTRRDAELTKAIYRRVPVLIDKSRRQGGNPWGVRFVRMFDQTNDAELFREPADLKKQGFRLEGNRWRKGTQVYLPLYEAKMFRPYDHRHGSVFIEEGNWINQGQTEELSLVQHQNPEHLAQPRWWVEYANVTAAVPESSPALLAFRDITRTTDWRSVIASFLPYCGAMNTAPLIDFDVSRSARSRCCVLANLNAVFLDYVARQKIGGIHLNFFILEQLPIFPPSRYGDRCPWAKRQTLEKWVSDRVLKLTCTAEDMTPLAEAAGFSPPVHRWDPAERAQLLAELDAAYFLLYGISRDDAEYVLGTFSGLSDGADALPGHISPAQAVLQAYDRLAAASS